MVMMGCGGLFGCATFGVWVWSLVDIIRNEPSGGNDKIIWIVVVVLLGCLGSAIYYFVRRPERIRQFGK
ncbi:hypothetical protein DB346_05975 [Verrucomicrobia bacterium LW23]|nr:hypothetical protein DB346_05975 [Verrucomicrobia bacterium LW23]